MPEKEKKPFTPGQLQAIGARGRDVLVSAAAGSGKTAVLVERIVRLVAENGVDVDRLLVVTFTEAAAAEMRERISGALFDRLAYDPDNERLRRQITLLGKASISTIHAFCLDVARKYFYLTDADPGFKVGDQIETELLKADVIAALFEEEYDKEDNQGFLNLVDAYGGPKISDDSLVELVLELHEFLCSIPWSGRWLCEKRRLFAEAGEEGGFAPWLPVIAEHARSVLEAAMDNLDEALRLAQGPDGPGHYADTLRNDGLAVRALADDCATGATLGAMYEGLSALSFGRLPGKKGGCDEIVKEKVKLLRESAKDALGRLKKEVFFKPPDMLREDMGHALPALETLCALTERFGEAYRLAKKERNIADFNDLERFCLDVLLAPGATPEDPAPSEAARALSEKYEEIMIDEYQDSNAVQELILSLAARPGAPNRFMVGDIKQSIYRFRRANPEIFLRKYNSFSDTEQAGENGVPAGLRIDLSQNFRSRSAVLDAVNFLFSQLMTERVGDIPYDDKAALYPGQTFPGDGPPVELHIVEKAGTTGFEREEEADNGREEAEDARQAWLEADVAAERIVEMIEGPNPLQVLDSGTKGFRRLRYGDVVILMRSVRSAADAFTAALAARGVPFYTETGKGYFYSQEIATVLALLQIIDNPKQDIPLLTALRSPVYGLTPDELLSLRQARDKCTFHDAMLAYFENADGTANPATLRKLEAFLPDLARWRGMAVYTPISALIAALYDDTGYTCLVGAMPGGDVRQANLTALLEVAAAFEKTSYKGLFHFNKYMEKLRRHGQDAGDSKLFSENENVVRIMTIHKSKGLEFPVVFVSMLGTKFSAADERADVLLHQELGFGPRYVDATRRVKTKTLAGAALALQIRRENLSEELRMLYVAMTRAKEKLVLTGSAANMEKCREAWGRTAGRAETPLPLGYMTAGRCFLDWIAAAVARHRDGETLCGEGGASAERGNSALYNHPALFAVFLHSQDGQSARETLAPLPQAAEPKEARPGLPAEAGVSAETCAKLEWEYSYLAECGLPSKISITEIKRLRQEEADTGEYAGPAVYQPPVFVKPDFLRGKQGFSAAEIGTFTHAVMERLDVRAHTTPAHIEALLARLVSQRILTEEEAAAVPLQKIVEFTRSGLAERMRRAKIVKKETPFVMALRPGEVYPNKRFEDAGARILAHGIIDCYFIEENCEAVLVDYKSDHVGGGAALEAVKRKYAVQLQLYKRALERSEGLRVGECLLYLFAIGQDVPLEME